jgi:esterase/lipase superfamily enzyme
MQRSYHRWFSSNLGRDMELLVFGHGGMRVLAFPTSCNRFYEWENHGLVHALSDQIEPGRIQLFCVDGIDEESWYAGHKWPGDRAWRHVQYDTYVHLEVVPFTQQVNPNPMLTVVGASFGAYHAVNFTLRHPETAGRVIGMSGIYDIRRFTSGHTDHNVYCNNPCDFIAGEHEPGRLDALRRLDIILAVGGTDRLLEDNQRLSALLCSREIWHALRIWDGFAHDWPAWDRMLHLYLHGHD